MSSKYPTNDGETLNPDISEFTFSEPKVFWIYIFWMFTAVYCLLYVAFNKLFLSKPNWYQVIEQDLLEKSAADMAKLEKTVRDHRFQLDENVQRAVQPLRFDVFGKFGYLLMNLVSLLWPVLFILVLVDYYSECQVEGIDNLCFYGEYPVFGNYDVNSRVLFSLWACSSVWFAFWLSFRGRIVNWFRVKCTADKATHVFIRQQQLHPEVLTANPNFLVRLFRVVSALRPYHLALLLGRLVPPLQAWCVQAAKAAKGDRYIEVSERIQRTQLGTWYFLFQGTRHFFNDKLGSYQPIQGFNVSSLSDFHVCKDGLMQDEAEELMDSVGPNVIPFKVDGIVRLLTNEFFTFFYLYQWIMYTVWFWFSYIFIAGMLVSIVFLAAALNVFTSWRNQKAIAKVAHYETEVEVLRRNMAGSNGDKVDTWVKISCTKVVPGDIMKMQEDWKLPCDLVLVQGACVCDESSLTGEAHPIQKIECPNDSSVQYTEKKGSRYTLYAGTTLLQLERGEHEDVLAVVIATGIQTGKGKLISHILYPQKLLFKYNEELPIVAGILIVFALIVFPIAIWFQILAGTQATWVTRWAYGIFTVSQILNPILPVTLSVGQIKSSIRLGIRKIYTLNPARIAVSGKIRLFCFDKTGTLTKPGLDFLQFKPTTNARDKASVERYSKWAMATAHAVTKFKEQFIGNQVEVRMFEACGWTLKQRGGQPPIVVSPDGLELDVVKRFEFDHSRMTMSVLVRDQEGSYFVFIKGSFEAVAGVCDPSSVPDDYYEKGKKLALDGIYVLGVGYKTFKWDPSYSLEKLTRDEVEAKGSITMLGYLLFRNELKEDTPAAIAELREGAIRPVMITGDNAQTGFFIARKCGFVDKGVTIMLAQMEKRGSIVWKPMAGADEEQPSEQYTTEQIKGMKDCMEEGCLELAVNGQAFQELMSMKFYNDYLFFFRIFSRVTPEEKVAVVSMFRDRGLIVGMCGDGGNDCGALRIAHAGVALSDAEASLVSPFTSQDKSITSVVELLKEGRCALHTSFGAYKFIIIYGQLFAILKLCSFWFGVILCQMDYLMFDGIAVITLPIAMTMAMPLNRLNQFRPTSSLLSPTTVASVLGLMVIYLIYMAAALVHMREQPEYVEWPSKLAKGASWWVLGDNWESTVIYFQQFFAFIGAGLVFSFGSKYRQPFFKNFIFMGVMLVLFIINSLLLLLPQNSFSEYWHVASEQFNSDQPANDVWVAWQQQGNPPSGAMPFSLRLELYFIALASITTAILWQRLVVEGPLGDRLANARPSSRPIFRV